MGGKNLYRDVVSTSVTMLANKVENVHRPQKWDKKIKCGYRTCKIDSQISAVNKSSGQYILQGKWIPIRVSVYTSLAARMSLVEMFILQCSFFADFFVLVSG